MKATTSGDGGQDTFILQLSAKEASVLDFAIANVRGLLAKGRPWIREHMPSLAPMPDEYAHVLDRQLSWIYEAFADNPEFIRERRLGFDMALAQMEAAGD